MTFCHGILTIIIRNYIWLHLEERTKTLHAECDKTTYKYAYSKHLLDLKKVCVMNLELCVCVYLQDWVENSVPVLSAVLLCAAWLCLGLRT